MSFIYVKASEFELFNNQVHTCVDKYIKCALAASSWWTDKTTEDNLLIW